MADRLKSRILALERARPTDRGPTGGVVTFGVDETPDEALERAREAGVTGGVLLVPTVMTYEAWQHMVDQETGHEKS